MAVKLYLQVYFFRALTRLAALIDRYFVAPKVQGPAFSVTIPTQLSKIPGNITIYFYTPPGYQRAAHSLAKKDYPLVVNFHGGGFTLGQATDDGRWATTLLRDVNVIFASVGYRKGPEYPQPTAVEDCVDGLRWLWAHADSYGFDPHRTILTGFSAGGNLTLSSALRHYIGRKDEAPEAAAQDGRLTGIVAFYPSVNQSLSREHKAQSNPISMTKGSISPWLYRIFDDSYYQNLPPTERTAIYLSPALASKEVHLKGLPEKLALYTCEWDQLLVEAEDFRKKLKDLGKTVGGYMAKDVAHGFDKFPGKANIPKRDSMYRDAVKQIKSMI